MAITKLANPKEDYLDLISKLAQGNGSSKAKIASILSSTLCDKLAHHLISDRNGYQEDVRFDSYYREKHELGKRKLVERLKSKLENVGKTAHFFMSTEEVSDLGRFDLSIVNGNKLEIQDKNGKKIIVEIKASIGFDLAQIERYLFSGESLLITRIMTGQVKLLRPKELSCFLNESIIDLISKTKRILEGRLFPVPGYECYQCPLKDCDYNKLKTREYRFISMRQEEFENDFDLFMQNLYPTIDKAVQIILEELQIVKPTPIIQGVEQQSSSQLGEPQSQPCHPHGKDTESHAQRQRGS